MPDVSYSHLFPYPVGADDRAYPGLLLQLRAPDNPESAVDFQAYLDTGAEYSLFEGGLASAIGLTIAERPPRHFNFTTGFMLTARRLPVLIFHEVLGEFQLEVAFSEEPIRRNLLGRDFLDMVQIGFREHHQEFYASREP